MLNVKSREVPTLRKKKKALKVEKSTGTENVPPGSKTTADDLWKAGQNKLNFTHDLHHTAGHSSLNHELSVAKTDWLLESEVGSIDPGRGQILAKKDSLKGQE